jgi:hypothetical protein
MKNKNFIMKSRVSIPLLLRIFALKFATKFTYKFSCYHVTKILGNLVICFCPYVVNHLLLTLSYILYSHIHIFYFSQLSVHLQNYHKPEIIVNYVCYNPKLNPCKGTSYAPPPPPHPITTYPLAMKNTLYSL